MNHAWWMGFMRRGVIRLRAALFVAAFGIVALAAARAEAGCQGELQCGTACCPLDKPGDACCGADGDTCPGGAPCMDESDSSCAVRAPAGAEERGSALWLGAIAACAFAATARWAQRRRRK